MAAAGCRTNPGRIRVMVNVDPSTDCAASSRRSAVDLCRLYGDVGIPLVDQSSVTPRRRLPATDRPRRHGGRGGRDHRAGVPHLVHMDSVGAYTAAIDTHVGWKPYARCVDTDHEWAELISSIKVGHIDGVPVRGVVGRLCGRPASRHCDDVQVWVYRGKPAQQCSTDVARGPSN